MREIERSKEIQKEKEKRKRGKDRERRRETKGVTSARNGKREK